MAVHTRIALIVKIVQQTNHPPALGIALVMVGIGPHHRFYPQRMLTQAVTQRILTEQGPGGLAWW